MRISKIIHKIPTEWILGVIILGMAILLVYFIATIHALRNELEQKEFSDTQAREIMMQRARDERQEDMMNFFTTNKISCSCEE